MREEPGDSSGRHLTSIDRVEQEGPVRANDDCCLQASAADVICVETKLSAFEAQATKHVANGPIVLLIKVHPADAPRSRVGEGEHAERVDEPERTTLGIVVRLTVLILFDP